MKSEHKIAGEELTKASYGYAHRDARSHEMELEVELEQLMEENAGLCVEVSVLKERMDGEKQRYMKLWRLNCQQLADTGAEKEKEIESLRMCIAKLEGHCREMDYQ